MGLFDDEPRPSAEHRLGEKLDGLSVEDIDRRIAALNAEIDRLKEERVAKLKTRDTAELAFKPSLGGN